MIPASYLSSERLCSLAQLDAVGQDADEEEEDDASLVKLLFQNQVLLVSLLVSLNLARAAV